MTEIVEHTDAEACERAAQKQVDAAFFYKKEWMVVVFSKEGDQVTVEKTSCSFPRGFFDECLNTLKRMLEVETSNSKISHGILPLAPHIMGEVRPQRLTQDQRDRVLEGVKKELAKGRPLDLTDIAEEKDVVPLVPSIEGDFDEATKEWVVPDEEDKKNNEQDS